MTPAGADPTDFRSKSSWRCEADPTASYDYQLGGVSCAVPLWNRGFKFPCVKWKQHEAERPDLAGKEKDVLGARTFRKKKEGRHKISKNMLVWIPKWLGGTGFSWSSLFYVFVSGFLLMAHLELAVHATWFSLGNPPKSSGHMWSMIRVACVLELWMLPFQKTPKHNLTCGLRLSCRC